MSIHTAQPIVRVLFVTLIAFAPLVVMPAKPTQGQVEMNRTKPAPAEAESRPAIQLPVRETRPALRAQPVEGERPVLQARPAPDARQPSPHPVPTRNTLSPTRKNIETLPTAERRPLVDDLVPIEQPAHNRDQAKSVIRERLMEARKLKDESAAAVSEDLELISDEKGTRYRATVETRRRLFGLISVTDRETVELDDESGEVRALPGDQPGWRMILRRFYW
jgi:hypothetical protein